MWKWLIPLGGVALLVAFILWQRDSEKTSYVNGLAEYIKLPDREFLFERDCYIFKLKARDTAWPLVGTKALVPGLPAEVDPKNIGAEFPDVRIIDVVHAGARFKIFSVRRDESRRGTFITFEIQFMDATTRKYPRLDAFFLLDHSPEKNGAPPEFIETYAVPRVKK